MEALIGLGVLVIICMLAGIRSRMADIEKAIQGIKNTLTDMRDIKNTLAKISTRETLDEEASIRLETPELAEETTQKPMTPPPIPSNYVARTETASVAIPSASIEKTPPVAPVNVPSPIEPAGQIPPSPTTPPPIIHAPPKPAASAARPSWFDAQLSNAKAWLFSEGNIWVTVGVLLFLAGFGMLFSYAAQMKWISLETRLALAALVGISMTAFGWRMRILRRVYALVLQGGGVGVLYIVLFAGAKLGPIPSSFAVVGMVALSAFTIFLSMKQNFEPLALFALLGGYSAPIIVSTGSQNFVALFSIYSLLNFEILVITARRDWRYVRWGGMMASAAVGAAWGLLRWRESYFASVEPFILLYFVNYSAVSLLPMLKERLGRYMGEGSAVRVDKAMALSLPFIFLVLQISASSHTRYGSAVSCALLGAWYLFLSSFTLGARNDEIKDGLPEIFLAYGIMFLNMTAPFLFGKAATSSIWAVEGAFLIAYRSITGHRLYGIFGIALHKAAFLLYVSAPFLHLPERLYERAFRMNGLLDWRTADSNFASTAMIFAASALVSGYFTSRQNDAAPRLERKPLDMWIPWGFSIYGAIWWTLSVVHISEFILPARHVSFMLLCAMSAAAYGMSMFEATRKWDSVRSLAVIPITATILASIPGQFLPAVFRMMADGSRDALLIIFMDAGTGDMLNWIAVAVMFAAAACSYRATPDGGARKAMWGAALFAAVQYTSWTWGTNMNRGMPGTEWRYLVSYLPVFAAIVALTVRRFSRTLGMDAYRISSATSCALLWAIHSVSFVAGLTTLGHGIANRYIPFINPLELWQALYITSLGILLAGLKGTPENRLREMKLVIMPLVVFVWLNSIAARSAWHYFGELARWELFTAAPHFQAITAILWGVTALVLIGFGKKTANRYFWFLGAGLLLLDIAKLLVIDLRTAATIIRIIAFLVLGGFFFLVGWNAPLPPRKSQ
ncbi:MAG: DUF2339 domain-containing protein [Synergistaceae bacterium]|jgi:uncharacterized membrane protein|nr:DUF2339 domain-containing protein [Synergistaceae bacterium]